MNWQFNCRILSLLITAGLVFAIEKHSYWLALVIGLGFVHYALSFYYARSRIVSLAKSDNFALPVLSLVGLCSVVYFLKFPLEVYFGLHHAFNEGYLKRFSSNARSNAEQLLAPFRCLLHLAAYFCILRNDSHLTQLPEWSLWAFAAISCFLYGLKLRDLIREGGLSKKWSQHSVELGLIAFVGLSFFIKISFLQIVLYHFVLWTLLPLPMMKQRGNRQLEQYLLLTMAALMFFFGGLMMVSPSSFSIVLAVGLSQFYLWSYIHITASMALSSAHPEWIVRLFTPVRKSVAAPL